MSDTVIDVKDIKPCAGCKGPLIGNAASGKTGNFYRVTVESALPKPSAIREYMGLAMYFGNEALADVFVPDREGATVYAKTTVLLCFKCAIDQAVAMVPELEEKK